MTYRQIKLSIALLTRNRPESLNRCLESLRSQNVQPFEVIISDNSDPNYMSATEDIAHRWDSHYIIGSQRGLCSNRNHAALACQGTHIRTMDDDHVLPPGHLEQCLEAITSDPLAIWTTGEVGYINGQYHATAPTANQLSPSGVGRAIINYNDNWGIADGSTIYPRSVYDRGYRMLEDYEYGESSLEFGAYLYAKGFRSRCILGAYVEHYAEETTLTRRSLTLFESRLYSSLCYNLYFKINYILALKYTSSYLWRLRKNPNLLATTTTILAKVKKRWRVNGRRRLRKR